MAVQSQQVTKDQLLNLFFQANTALNNNQTEAAVEFYNKIFRLLFAYSLDICKGCGEGSFCMLFKKCDAVFIYQNIEIYLPL